MPFKFLDDTDAAPVTQPGSVSFKFDDESEGVPPSADDLQGLMAQGYKPNNDDLKTIYEKEQQTPFLKRVWEGTKEGVSGVVMPFVKAPGEVLKDPSAGRLLSSAGEGVSGAAAGTIGMVTRPFSYLYDKAFNAPFRTPAQDFDKWKLNYLATHDVGQVPLPESIMKSWSEFALNEPVTDSAMIKPYPNLSSAIGTVASIPMFEAGASATGLSKFVATPKLNITKPALNAAGKVAEKVGSTFKWVGERPAAVAEGVSKRLLGEELAANVGKTVKAGELPIAATTAVLGEPVSASVLAGAKLAEKTAPAITGAGQFAQRLAKADPVSPFGRLYSVAKDATAPDWMRHLANSWVSKVPAAMAETAATGAKAAGVGALFGAGLEAISGGSPEQIGHGIGSGVAFGVLTAAASAPKLRKMKIMERSLADIENLYQAHVSEGISPESLKKVGNDAMTWAATMQRVFGDGTKIRFAGKEKGSPLPEVVHSQAGMWQPETKTLWINLDAARDPGVTVLHEILHPIYEGAVANRPELKTQIDQALLASGRTLYSAKVRYSMSLMKRQLESVKDPLQKRAMLDQVIQARDAQSQATSGDPNAWAYSEILAEAGARALHGQHPIFEVLEPGVMSAALDTVKGFLEKIGVEFKEKPSASGKPATVLPGFENVIDSPALRKTVYSLIKAQKEFLPGLTPAKEQGVKLNKEMWGNHPGATLETRANGVTGNDFVVKKTDGTIAERPAREVRKIVRNRRKEVNDTYPLNAPPLASTDKTPGVRVRNTPSGLVERSGTQLGPEFDKLTSFGDKTKANARDLEQAIAKGESREGWYQQIGESAEWKASVQKDTGAIEAQYKEFIPINFLVDKQGNILVRNYSLTALERKATDWAARKGPVSLELWGGDIAKFKQDVATYLKNHKENLPGESNGVGLEKKNVINAFLVGGNRTFEAKNPLRNSLRGQDRQGIVRSYRLDRLETIEPGKSDLAQPEYHKQVMNLSPEVENAKLDPEKFAERTGFTLVRKPQTTGAIDLSKIDPAILQGGPEAAKVQAIYDELLKLQKPAWEFTDKRENSATLGRTFRVAQGATLKEAVSEFQKVVPEVGGKYSPDIRDTSKEYVTQAALKFPDGTTYLGGVHAIAAMWADAGGHKLDTPGMIEGFVTNTGRFVDRMEAKKLAMTAGQIDPAKAVRYDKVHGEPGGGPTMSSRTPLEAVSFSSMRNFSPDVKVFSQAEKVINEKFKGESMPKAQLAAMLRNPQHGVKAEEMKWSGLDDFLKGEGRVTKKEVQEFLRLNNLKVEEVVKGENNEPQTPDFQITWITEPDGTFTTRYEDYRYTIRPKNPEDTYEKGPFVLDSDAFGDPIDGLESVDAAKAIMRRHLELDFQESARNDNRGDTLYSQWQLPGGEDYREILFTLPVTEKSLPEGWRVEETPEGKWALYNPNGSHLGSWLSKESAIKSQTRQTGSKIFESSHWEEKNILAHARVNTRKTSDDSPVLFVEEIQSDWHQRGRREGYSNPPMTAEEKAQAEKKIETLNGKMSEIATRLHSASLEKRPSIQEEYNRVMTERNELTQSILGQKGVPDAPFKKDWHEMVFRRLTAKAVEEGTDFIAWTTGEQQAERYDLSKHISKVSFEPKDSGDFSLGTLYAYDLNNKQVMRQTDIEPHQIADYIGKEPADKLLSEMKRIESEKKEYAVDHDSKEGEKHYFLVDPNGEVIHDSGGDPYTYDSLAHATDGLREYLDHHYRLEDPTISGLDLKVGGEGMMGFYDKILVDYANKFGKKFGAKVQEISIPQEHDASQSSLFVDRAKAMQVLRNGGELYATFPRVAGEQLVKSEKELLDLEAEFKSKANGYYLGDSQPETKVHALPITPDMRVSLKQSGIPLFSPDVTRLYRGEYTGNKGGKFYHTDPEFARQFTQSGQDHEIKYFDVDPKAIFKPEPLPYGGDPDAVDAAVSEARKQGFKAVWVDEGSGGSPSVYVFNRNVVKGLKPYESPQE